MLIGPGGVPACSLCHFENGVYADGIVRKLRDALAILVDVSRQGGWINHVQRDGWIAGVLVNGLVEHLHVPRLSLAGSVGRVKNAAIETDVVKQPMTDR